MKLTDICEFHGGSQPPKSEWSSEYKDGYIRMLQIRDFTQEALPVLLHEYRLNKAGQLWQGLLDFYSFVS